MKHFSYNRNQYLIVRDIFVFLLRFFLTSKSKGKNTSNGENYRTITWARSD